MMSRTVRRAAAGGWSACPPGARKLMAQEIPQEIPLTQHPDDPVRFVHYREFAEAGPPHEVFASGLHGHTTKGWTTRKRADHDSRDPLRSRASHDGAMSARAITPNVP